MRICGIVSEYNPFHYGHQHHILLTREKTGADLIICVMSGNFVQRGEPAVFDKWVRTECALKCGADAVLELPFLYAVQSAEGFASGGIAVLDAAGASSLSFGCETEDIETLKVIAQKLYCESDEYRKSLKALLDIGLSFPQARMKASFPDAPGEAVMPNAILGIEYIKAILRSGSDIKPFAIKRIGQGYHSEEITEPLASATAIRKALGAGNFIQAFAAMPQACADYIVQMTDKGLKAVMPGFFDDELIYILRRGGPEYIKALNDVSEGLENRIYEASAAGGNREDLIQKIKTKRYTYTRISRILLYALLGITRDMVKKRNSEKIDHIRVLGVKNEYVLSALSKTCSVPLVCGSVSGSCYPSIDVMASDVYALSQDKKPFCEVKRDYTEKLIIGQHC